MQLNKSKDSFFKSYYLWEETFVKGYPKTYPPESLEFREGLEQLPVKPVAEQTHSMGLPGFYFIWANHQL